MKIILYFFFLTIAVASCENLGDHPEEFKNENITQAQLEQQFSEIEKYIAQGSCTGSEQCSFIPYGRKACGGPQGYLVFSTKVDNEKLQEMVNRYTKMEIAYNEQNQVMSDCSLPPEPAELGCENGNCIRIK
ncbi:hypothetical protein LZ575_15860 [Antarcticibacterium sp. 1MA-6-2]|uniref:hypothetical protein n=1 Tax=Antarcticibacterium sp. 1MA-6-2 TaxID=2908210 RepID=UPI001F3CFAD3|nr:hypothetical protein [Antarcticibacterium sp. 1MA-6-2]UJH90318.1 hypothetical protein LZ575_15860 [Antarcticibacterium sp. 1MA-6-2]